MFVANCSSHDGHFLIERDPWLLVIGLIRRWCAGQLATLLLLEICALRTSLMAGGHHQRPQFATSRREFRLWNDFGTALIQTPNFFM